MKTLGLITILSFTTLVACTDKREEQYTSSEELRLDSFQLDNINPGSRINYYPADDDMTISYVSADGSKVYFYSVNKKANTDSIKFDRRDMDEQYYVDENKNTYIYITDQNTLLIRDSAGREKIVFKKPEYIYYSWDTFKRSYAAISLPLEVIDSTLILNNLQGYHLADKRERKLYFSKEHLSFLRVNGDSLVKEDELADFPEFYRNNYIDENWAVATRVGKDDLYYLYSNDNLLYRYHLPTHKTEKFTVRNLTKNKIKSYDIDRISDFSYTNEYEINISSYLRLLHDYKTNQFIVFQMLPVKEKKQDGMLYLYEDKPVLLNLVDTALNVYKKIYFKNHVKFNLLYACYYNGKLYLTERYSRSNHKRSSIKVYVYEV